MNEQEIFESIKSRIDLINQQIYLEYSIESIKRKKEKEEKINTYEGDLILLENRLSKQKPIGKQTINKMKQYDSVMLNINEVLESSENSCEKKETIAWKNLDIDTKLTKFKEYMDNTNYSNFPDKLLHRVIQLIKDDKLNKKKYLIYNEEQQKIHDIPVINYDSNIQEYYLRSDRENKKKKISKIFK